MQYKFNSLLLLLLLLKSEYNSLILTFGTAAWNKKLVTGLGAEFVALSKMLTLSEESLSKANSILTGPFSTAVMEGIDGSENQEKENG